MIEVFKTNVQEASQSEMMVGRLLEHFPDSVINFDLEDCDKILRIHASEILNHKIIEVLNSHGFYCEVLL
jgi:tRNA G26 N,N-dimethylase Trm1